MEPNYRQVLRRNLGFEHPIVQLGPSEFSELSALEPHLIVTTPIREQGIP